MSLSPVNTGDPVCLYPNPQIFISLLHIPLLVSSYPWRPTPHQRVDLKNLLYNSVNPARSYISASTDIVWDGLKINKTYKDKTSFFYLRLMFTKLSNFAIVSIFWPEVSILFTKSFGNTNNKNYFIIGYWTCCISKIVLVGVQVWYEGGMLL